MKYYLIVGEASGDLHASHLMAALKVEDPQAEFRFFGGDLMAAVGGTMVKHYKELAYMGFIPVLLHLRTIFANMKRCKEDIVAWQPDVVILVDYPGFNLNIAKFLRAKTQIPVYYYISPKIWAWKEYRIKNIKRDVDELFSILPFEVEFFEGKHNYPIHYVGNPTVDEVTAFRAEHPETYDDFIRETGLESKPIIALLAGSRKQEIKDNLPDMLRAASAFPEYQLVLAGAPGISPDYYHEYIGGAKVKILFGQTYRLLQQAEAALVTSGTATLETALFRVPQAVCYHTPIGKVISFLRRHILTVKYISLVNLIANREVVKELVADTMKKEAKVAVYQAVIQAMEEAVARKELEEKGSLEKKTEVKRETAESILAKADLSKSMPKKVYEERLKELQKKMEHLHGELYRRRIPVVLGFEGWDAGGKGGAIKRLTSHMDPRGYVVNPTASPSDTEKAHHYLWRFWRAMPKAGHIAIFDRTWYGRVMVERIEGFCTEKEWERAYGEINAMEQDLVNAGAIVLKFWMQIDKDEQARRFKARQENPKKQWKITDEDWRNREKWDQYEVAIEEMLEKTSMPHAPWIVVEGNDKYYARIKVLECVTEAIEKRLKEERK